MTYPTLRERVRAVLLAAGFAAREDTLPTFATRGTFDLTSGAGVRVSVSWWDSTPDQRRELLARFDAALEAAGMVVADQGEWLHVGEQLANGKTKTQRGFISSVRPSYVGAQALGSWGHRSGRGACDQ